MKTSIQRRSGLTVHIKAASLALSVGGALLAAPSSQASAEIYDTAGVAICCFATNDNTARTVSVGAFLQTDNAAFAHFSQNYDPIYGAVANVSTNNVAGLTSGGVFTSFSGLRGKYPYLPSLTGIAAASSDLATGQLHVLAASERPPPAVLITPPGYQGQPAPLSDYYSIASADARFSTDFHTSNTTGADMFVAVSWRVEGTISGPVLPLQARSFFGMSVDFNDGQSSTSGFLDYEVDPNTGQISTSALMSSTDSFANSFTTVDLGGDSRLMTGLFDIRPGLGVGFLKGLTQLVCWQGAVCDFSHTSSLSLGALPTGVTFNFDAPGFLGGYGSANGGVPEPATWAMLLLGFGGLGAVLRRRRAEAAESVA